MRSYGIHQHCKIDKRNVTPARENALVAINLESTDPDSRFQNFTMMIEGGQSCCAFTEAKTNCDLKEGYVSDISIGVTIEDMRSLHMEVPKRLECECVSLGISGASLLAPSYLLTVFTVNGERYWAYLLNDSNSWCSHPIWHTKTEGEDTWKVGSLTEDEL